MWCRCNTTDKEGCITVVWIHGTNGEWKVGKRMYISEVEGKRSGKLRIRWNKMEK